jgi:FkbM family methyltransferase
MLIEFDKLLEHGITPRGVIHLGMHKAEEYSIYARFDLKPIVFVEANPDLCQYCNLQISDPHVIIINAAAADVSDTIVRLNITNNSESSSILQLKDHAAIYPAICNIRSVDVATICMDDIFKKHKLNYSDVNILNLDIQGAELMAMKGLTNWDNIDAVFTEVNYREMYAGCSLISEIDSFLFERGFEKAEEVDTGCGWGDALYVKSKK